jgi:tetratricopeptide (TPR) repeat protein
LLTVRFVVVRFDDGDGASGLDVCVGFAAVARRDCGGFASTAAWGCAAAGPARAVSMVRVYRPWGFELWAPLQPLYQAGDYAAVADRAQEVLAGDPPYGTLYYNFACVASLAGRPDEALIYLRRAFELNEDLRDLATEDSDLAALRQDARFDDLLARR